MKQYLLKLFIGITCYLFVAESTWALKVFQCVNANNEVSFSGQPCGEGETLVKEHDIQSEVNIIGSTPTQTSPQSSSASVVSTSANGEENTEGATISPSGGGGSASGGGGGGGRRRR
jgi:uncharacterized membrane protein YgcG